MGVYMWVVSWGVPVFGVFYFICMVRIISDSIKSKYVDLRPVGLYLSVMLRSSALFV